MRSLTWRLGLGLALLSGILLAGFCRLCPPKPEDPLRARHAIRAWLECEECIEGELAAVVGLGEDAVPILAATLRDGLSPASRALLERQLADRYRARVAYGRQHEEHAPAWPRDEFIAHHVGNRDALHRSRAALALGRLRGNRAAKALREALARRQRPDVEKAIREALEEIHSRDPSG